MWEYDVSMRAILSMMVLRRSLCDTCAMSEVQGGLALSFFCLVWYLCVSVTRLIF